MFTSGKERTAVDLDDEGGTTFLRVLIHLIMQDYPPLVSGSLQLLFKHFSQRAEVLQAFKQVSGFLTSLTLLYLIITLFLDLYILHVVEYVCVCVCVGRSSCWCLNRMWRTINR